MHRSPRTPRRAPLGERLTPRETQVLALVAAGEPTPDIGRRLGIAPNTVKSHLTGIYDKTGSRNRVDAVRYYLDHYTTGEDTDPPTAVTPSARRARGQPSLLQRQIQEIDARIMQLKPVAEELDLLQRARNALRAADARLSDEGAGGRTR